MTEAQTFILAALAAYWFILLLIGIRSIKNQSYEDYTIGGRNVGVLPTLSSLASGFRDGAGIVFWIGAGLMMGYGPLWLIAGLFLALMFYTFYGPRVRELACKKGYISIGEFIHDSFGPHTQKLSALIVVFFSLMYVAMQLYVSGNITAKILDIDAWLGITTVASVIAIYLFWGGYNNVVKTDVLQFFIILGLLIVPIFISPSKEQVFDLSGFQSIGLQTGLSFFLIGIFWILSSADVWQRVFSARNSKVIQRAFPSSAIFFFLMTLSLTYIGFGVKNISPEGIEANDVFFSIFNNPNIAIWLQGFIAVGVMAITMSTLDTFCYLGASTLGKDVLPKQLCNTPERFFKTTRLMMLFILALMSFIAMHISDLIQFLFDSASLLFILAPLYVVAVLSADTSIVSKRRDYAASLSIITSCAVYIYLFVTGAFSNMLYMFIPAAISVVLIGISVTMCRASKDARF